LTTYPQIQTHSLNSAITEESKRKILPGSVKLAGRAAFVYGQIQYSGGDAADILVTYWQYKNGWTSWEGDTDSNGYYMILIDDYDSTATIHRVEAYSEDENGQRIYGTCGTYTILDESYFKIAATLVFGIASFNTGDDAYDNAIKLFSDLNSLRSTTINAGYTPPYLDYVKCPDTTMNPLTAGGCACTNKGIKLNSYSVAVVSG